MGILSDKNKDRIKGWMALSPLLVFLCVYLVSSIIAQDFYKIPISAAFLTASVYAMLITRDKTLEKRIQIAVTHSLCFLRYPIDEIWQRVYTFTEETCETF
jgi:Na+/H+ antiporter NhaC